MNKPLLMLALCLLTSITICGQCRYCKSYEDFLEDKWEPLDTVFCKGNSKSHRLWWGGNDYTLETGNKDTDKILKNIAFAVMQDDAIYINCRNLRHEKASFGKGYCKAALINKNDLLITNVLISRESNLEHSMNTVAIGYMFGIVGGSIYASVTANKQLKNKVCYILTSGADEKGHYDITLFEDQMMDKLLLSRDLIDLHNAYYAEKDKNKRRLASRILPILMEAGIIEAEE